MGDAKNKETECIEIDFLIEQLLFLSKNQFSGRSNYFFKKEEIILEKKIMEKGGKSISSS